MKADPKAQTELEVILLNKLRHSMKKTSCSLPYETATKISRKI